MNVALLANTAWLDEELMLYSHLIVGLIDEQVRVVQVLPESHSDEAASAYGQLVTWRETGLHRLDRWRLSRMVPTLQTLDIDLIHALDGRLWLAGNSLSARLGIPVCLSANSTMDVALARKISQHLDPQRCVFAASTGPIRERILAEVPAGFRVLLTPPGTHRVEAGPFVHDEKELALVVTCQGRLDDATHYLLDGLRMLIEDRPDTQVFIDTMASDQRSLWRAVDSMGLLGHVSFVPRRLGHREILLRADLLIQPQPLGRPRGILLQAMAQARPIIAIEDAALDVLIDGVTASVLSKPTAEDWHRELVQWCDHTEERILLGQSARTWINENRLASSHVGQTLSLYREMTAEPIVFSAADDSHP